jgi:hypothetical protein
MGREHDTSFLEVVLRILQRMSGQALIVF